MASLPFALQQDASASNPLRTGLALAVTVALFYGLCTLVWFVAPAPFMAFMNSLFHGVDFTPLLTSTGVGWGSFVGALVMMSVWAFLAGTFFAWIRQRLG